MLDLFSRFGTRLIFSKRNKCVRHSLVWFVTHSLAAAGIVLFIELVLILLGLANIYVPVNHQTLSMLSKLFI